MVLLLLACLVRVHDISCPHMNNVNEANYIGNSKPCLSKVRYMYLPYNGYIESCSRLRNTYSLGLKKTEIYLPASFVLKTLEKSDVLFPFTVAALTWNLYGQYSSKPVTDSIFVSNPELYKYIDFNFNIT